jgi:hypothetical protein
MKKAPNPARPEEKFHAEEMSMLAKRLGITPEELSKKACKIVLGLFDRQPELTDELLGSAATLLPLPEIAGATEVVSVRRQDGKDLRVFRTPDGRWILDSSGFVDRNCDTEGTYCCGRQRHFESEAAVLNSLVSFAIPKELEPIYRNRPPTCNAF